MLSNIKLQELKDRILREYDVEVELSYLHEAMTHSSTEGKSYETMEFFGDSIISFIVTEFLYHKYPEISEGDLTTRRAAYICGENLSKTAGTLELDKYVINTLESKVTPSIMSDVFESITAAVYLSSGIESVKRLLFKTLLNDEPIQNNYKSQLQELFLKRYGFYPEYYQIAEFGPEHRKTFFSAVKIENRIVGIGSGFSKKQSEQESAKNALLSLERKKEEE